MDPRRRPRPLCRIAAVAAPAAAAAGLGTPPPPPTPALIPAASSTGGQFTVQCACSHTLRDGTIAFPGRRGASHAHGFDGNVSTSAVSTHASLSSPPQCADQLRVHVIFPNCWDGVHLDSPDHHSHMAYSGGGRCPPGHPVALPRLVIAVGWRATPAPATVSLSSGPPPPCTPTSSAAGSRRRSPAW